MLARFHFRAGEPKKALELLEKAVTQAPDDSEVLELAGQVQLAAGERIRALATFSKWASQQPASPQALFRLATAQLANDDPSGAAASLRKAIQHRTRFTEAQVLLARVETSAGRHSNALQVAAQIQAEAPKSPLGWIVEGDVLMAAKKYAPAVKAYETALERRKSGESTVKLHAALVKAGRTQEAEGLLKTWIRDQPADLTSQYYLAEYYMESKRFADAVALYERLASERSADVVLLNNVAWCYQQLKDKRAVETAEKALKLTPDNPAVMDTLGWILVELGKVDKGVDLLRKAASLAPKSPDIRFHYASGLAKSGDRVQAKEQLERLLIEFPDFSEAAAAMSMLTELRKS
jgi:putative PEP-CTERM system TPR-repeat lipoprotein